MKWKKVGFSFLDFFDGLKSDDWFGFCSFVPAVVMTDKKTTRSKGFGFVTMKTAAAAQAALVEPFKQIDGRKTEVSCPYHERS